MPGIAGVIDPAGLGPETKTALDTMVKAMMHERFYVAGSRVFSPLPVAAGWVSHPGTLGSLGPVWNASNDLGLVFSGEHYADRPAPASANGPGVRDRALALLEAYAAVGEKVFEQLNGWFSGLLLDLRRSQAILFNDRYGLDRLYVHESGGRTYFASEAKCLLRLLPELRQLDPRGLGELLSCGCVLQNRTLFPGISVLPGGSLRVFDAAGRVAQKTYFQPKVWEDQTKLSREEYYEKLKATFVRILPRYFPEDDRVAISLTGGLDSRMILAWAPVPPFKLPCYTFGGMYRESADVRIARRIAEAAQQRFEIVPVTRKFFADFATLAKRSVYFSDGTMDVTGAVELYVNRLAREIAPVRLTGNYGDEILRGHVAFRPLPVPDALLAPEWLKPVREAGETYRAERSGAPLSFIAFKQVPWHHYGRFALERTQLRPRSPYLDNDLVAACYQVPVASAADCNVALRLIHEGDPKLARVPTDRGHRYGASALGQKLGQCAPKFTAKVEYAFDYGMPQWLTRFDRATAPLQPERWLLGHHKFYHFRTWYRHELAPYVRDILLDERTKSRPFWNRPVLEQMVESHVKGTANRTTEIHQLLTVELIMRSLIEPSGRLAQG